MSISVYSNLVLIGLAMLIAVSMVRFHHNSHFNNFNLVDLFTCKEGRVSRPACMEVGVWIVVTWGFVVLVNKDKLSDWYMAGYLGAFVLRAAHSAYLGSQNKGVEPK